MNLMRHISSKFSTKTLDSLVAKIRNALSYSKSEVIRDSGLRYQKKASWILKVFWMLRTFARRAFQTKGLTAGNVKTEVKWEFYISEFYEFIFRTRALVGFKHRWRNRNFPLSPTPETNKKGSSKSLFFGIFPCSKSSKSFGWLRGGN